MKIEKLSKVKDGRQDGAISNGFLFSFNHLGECTVYRLDLLECMKEEAEVFSEFILDKKDILMPHSNSVMFGNEYYNENDEFPLLYTNIYNNYSNCEEQLKGVCLVYRIQRTGCTFETTLVQMIEIGFVEDELWSSVGEKADQRPFGNFVVDTKQSLLYAFTMRDNTKTTRYFSFGLPKVADGEICEKYGVKKVVLKKTDIKEYFDCDYHHFVQGASCREGKIYSLEGFTNNAKNPPAIRIIDTKQKKEILFKYFEELGSSIEPEMIDFDGDSCYYTDHYGNVYKIIF